MMSQPIHCLVIQPREREANLQSLIALKAVKQLYPQLDISILCADSSAEFSKKVCWISSVSQVSDNHEMLDHPAVASLKERNWDLVINWNYTEASSFLASQLRAKYRIGFHRTSDGNFSSGDGWSQFIQAYVHEEVPQNIHFVDLLTTQALSVLQTHYGEGIDAGSLAVTGKDFFSLSLLGGERILDPSRPWIGIQIDTYWSEKDWVRLIKLILERHPEDQIVLLGSESEKKRALEINRKIQGLHFNQTRLLNLVAELDEGLWIDVIAQCQWMITSDDYPANIAAALGTRVLSLRKDPSFDFFHLPYGNGHLVLGPTDPGVPVAPEAIYSAWSYNHFEWSHKRNRSFKDHLRGLGFESLESWIDLRVGGIRSVEAGGGLVYRSEFARPLSTNDWISSVNGQIARLWYCGWTSKLYSEIDRSAIRPSLLQDLRALEESSSVLLRISHEAVQTAKSLYKKSIQLKSSRIMSLEDRSAFELAGKRLLELQKLVDRLGTADDYLRGFSSLLKVHMLNISSDKIVDASKEALIAWQQVERGTDFLRGWIKETLALARPISVETSSLEWEGTVQ